MLVPISWLKDFVEIKLPLKELCWRLTEVGLAVERVIKDKADTILELEITPNRPDCLSILGIAREIAAIEKSKINPSTSPRLRSGQVLRTRTQNFKTKLKIKIANDYKLCPRYTGIIISGVTIKPSPLLIQERLKKIGLRPINNIVDLSNYVMWELGNPIHCFDYDKIIDKNMHLQKSLGGEEFTSVDEIFYRLPANAIIIKDKDRVIDLCGLKGGLNTGISNSTKNIFIHVPVYDPVLIRRASQALGLRSDASAIFERGVNRGGTVEVLIRLTNLILKFDGGKVISEIIDLKQEEFSPWKLKISVLRANKLLGYEIDLKIILKILETLNLSPKLIKKDIFEVTVPTYRNDLKIEEDIIEEVARHYGYNKFPKTLPTGEIRTKRVPYYKDYNFEEKVKNLMTAGGFSEVYTYGLISKAQLEKLNYNHLPGGGDPAFDAGRHLEGETAIKISNPVNLDYEYLRPSITGNLLEAIKLNQPNFEEIRLFELGKAYKKIKNYESRQRRGSPLTAKIVNYEEKNYLVAVVTGEKFPEIKGIVQRLLGDLNIKNVVYQPLDTSDLKSDQFSLCHPFKTAKITLASQGEALRGWLGIIGEIHPDVLERFQIKGKVTIIDLNCSVLEKLSDEVKKYQSISLYPAIIEDLTFVFPKNILVGEVVTEISKISHLITKVIFIDAFDNARTFRIYFQSQERNLTEKEVKGLREKIIKKLKENFSLKLKEKAN